MEIRKKCSICSFFLYSLDKSISAKTNRLAHLEEDEKLEEAQFSLKKNT